jgi:hypothetical protein
MCPFASTTFLQLQPSTFSNSRFLALRTAKGKEHKSYTMCSAVRALKWFGGAIHAQSMELGENLPCAEIQQQQR